MLVELRLKTGQLLLDQGELTGGSLRLFLRLFLALFVEVFVRVLLCLGRLANWQIDLCCFRGHSLDNHLLKEGLIRPKEHSLGVEV